MQTYLAEYKAPGKYRYWFTDAESLTLAGINAENRTRDNETFIDINPYIKEKKDDKRKR